VRTLYTLKVKLSKIVSNKSLFQVMARYSVADHVSLERVMELFQVSLELENKLDLSKFSKKQSPGKKK